LILEILFYYINKKTVYYLLWYCISIINCQCDEHNILAPPLGILWIFLSLSTYLQHPNDDYVKRSIRNYYNLPIHLTHRAWICLSTMLTVLLNMKIKTICLPKLFANHQLKELIISQIKNLKYPVFSSELL